MLKELKIHFSLAFFISFIFLSCGGGGAKVKILIPANQANPFQQLLQNEDTASFYFRFIPLENGFSSMCDVQAGSAPIWYPAETGEGVPAVKTGFSIKDAALTEGVYYRVELYAKKNFSTPDSPRPGEFYGYPDCPLRAGDVESHKVNICFGALAPDPVCDSNPTLSATCAGMVPFPQCFNR